MATFQEITQQPGVWRAAADTVRRRRAELGTFLEPLLKHENLRIVLTGAGSSAFVGQIAAPALGRRLGRRVEAIATTDLVSHPTTYFAEDVPTLLVSFARSGDSPESNSALDLADQVLGQVSHLIVTCNPQGALYRAHSDRPGSFVLLMPENSNDAGFAMTSSFPAMLLSVLLVFLGEDDAAVEAVASAAEEILRADAGGDSRIQSLVARAPKRVVYLGSGPLAGAARESALKLLELTAGRVVTYHDSALGFRHGPKAVLDADTIAIVYVSSDPYSRLYDADIVAELRASLGDDRVLVLAPDAASSHNGTAWALGTLAGHDDAYLAVAYVVLAQLFGYHYSVSLGLTPDNPFPNGDVNRVVRGVVIHELPDSAVARKAGR